MINNIIDTGIVDPRFPVDPAMADHFLSDSNDHSRFVIGRNKVTQELGKNVKISAIVDDFFTEKEWQGIPVIKSSEMTSKACILNCSSSISPITVNNIFSEMNHNVIGYYEISHTHPNRFKLPEFVSQTREDYRNNIEQWDNLLSNLSDDKSRKTLIDLLKYRLSGDYNYLLDYSVRINQQYFEEFMAYQSERFVDAGGYDGDTSEEFIKRYPDFSHIYFFEPSSKNMKAAVKRLEKFSLQDKIDFIPYGLSNTPGELAFDPDAGSSSNIVETGNFKINVTTLDNYVKDNVSFVKMDLEGWELKALEGAIRHIRTNHPKLAIAVYHHPSHFRMIFDFVRNIRSDYDIYLRHYTEGWSETIMYFKPKQ